MDKPTVMLQWRNKRPDQGWPALWKNWQVGDSFPVIGSTTYVSQAIADYGDSPANYEVQRIGDNLTRVTRVR